jgi:hypothetical protein
MNIDQVYSNFIEYHEQQGREFPCTESQFINRAFEYAEQYSNINTEFDCLLLADLLCVKGIGPNWSD